MDVNVDSTKRVIESWSQSDDYAATAKKFLNNMKIPRDWDQVNTERIKELRSQFPDSIVLETQHYQLFSRADKRTTQELARRMDAVFELYDSMFGFEEKIPYKSLIIFWADKDEYLGHGQGPVNSVAYFSPSTKSLNGYDTRAKTDTQHMNFYESMFHEGWHQYFDFYIPGAPRWYDEGFAELFAPTDVKGRKAKMRRNAYQARAANKLLMDGKLIPLRRLIRMDYHEFMDPHNMSAAYASSYSFITFLMNFRSGDKKLEQQLRGFYKDYFWELRKGSDAEKAVDIVFSGVKLDVLEKLWQKSVRRQR